MTKFNKDFFDTFPLLYKDFGYISCDDGWYKLLYDLSDKLENILKDNSSVKINVVQIKSKFGELCFYVDIDGGQYDNENEKLVKEIREIIYAAEAKSNQTCEFCGKGDAKQMGRGWIYTSCQDCENIKSIIE